MAKLELHLEIDEDDSRAIDKLTSHCPLSVQILKRAADQGSIWLESDKHTRRLRRLKSLLKKGDALHLYYDEVIANQTPAEAKLIEDCTDYSVWYKPAGMFSQGSKWGDHCTITRYAEKNLSRVCFLVHRLDRATSGLMLVGHGKKVTAELTQAFAQREVKKCYRALIKGRLEPTETLRIDTPIDDKTAVSIIECKKVLDEKSLVDVTIETGRKHQIRKHLASIGHPVIGDRLYGNGDSSLDLQLAASELSFQCPISGEQKNYQLDEELLPGHGL